MSSRQEEKDRRRAEREAEEQAAARAQARKGRLQLGLGALVAIAAIALAVVVFGKKSNDTPSATKAPSDAPGVKLPALADTNLESAAKAAGCTLKTFPSEGRTHTTAKVTYKTNPPTSGAHNPVWAKDGLYDPGNEPPIGMTVHSLEHGRIDLQYAKGTPTKTVDLLEALGSEKLGFGAPGYKVLVFQNQTSMPVKFAATAWTHSLTCDKLSPAFYDAVRDFRTAYTDKGPEIIPANG